MAAGPADDPGINSRALVELFKVANERSAEVTYSLSASVLEIYNEQIRDLLREDGESRKHEVLTDKETGETYVSQATSVPVCTEEEILQARTPPCPVVNPNDVIWSRWLKSWCGTSTASCWAARKRACSCCPGFGEVRG